MRAGDYSIHLVPAAKALNMNNIVGKDLGTNKASSKKIEAVGEAKTANNARAKRDNSVTARITAFANNFYHAAGKDAASARQHLQVFRSYKYMEGSGKEMWKEDLRCAAYVRGGCQLRFGTVSFLFLPVVAAVY